MLQRLPIALAHVKTFKTLKMYGMKSGKSYIICIEKKKFLKNYIAI